MREGGVSLQKGSMREKTEFRISKRRLFTKKEVKINGLKNRLIFLCQSEALHLLPLREKRGAEIRRD